MSVYIEGALVFSVSFAGTPVTVVSGAFARSIRLSRGNRVLLSTVVPSYGTFPPQSKLYSMRALIWMFRLAGIGHPIFEKPHYFLGTALEPLSMPGNSLLILNIPCLVSVTIPNSFQV
jgi:hypothetical protein